jgi:hypothetical protein
VLFLSSKPGFLIGDLSVQRAQAEENVLQRADEKNDAGRKAETGSCKTEKGIVVFPAVEIKSREVKRLTCLLTNRDRLVGAFCNFRKEFAAILTQRGVDKGARGFWPNMCCSEEGETCKDGKDVDGNDVPQEKTVPFAGAQGGPMTRDTLYDEIYRTIKKGGYLHQGMLAALKAADGVDTGKMEEKLNKHIFHRAQLCGPREFDSPEHRGVKMCQLFLPYSQILTAFLEDFQRLFQKKDASDIQPSGDSFLEVSNLRRNRKGQNSQQMLGPNEGPKDPIDAEPKKTESYETCKIKMRKREIYKEMEKSFCYNNHVDLMNSDVMTIAMARVDKAIGRDPGFKEKLATNAKFSVGDVCTPVPMLTADGISMQHIRIDPFGAKSDEWVFLMKLDAVSKKGYLQSELSQCEATDYMPTSNINIAMYVDKEGCCTVTKDFSRCMRSEHCVGKIPTPLTDAWTKEQMAFRLEVIGGDFQWKKSEFVLPGTKFTSPICTNWLKKDGGNVNGGDVKNAKCEPVGSDSSQDDDVFVETAAKVGNYVVTEKYTDIKYSDGSDECDHLLSKVLEGVQYSDSDDKFRFNNNYLNACIIKVEEDDITVTVEGKKDGKTESVTLTKAKSGTVKYEFGGSRRRRLLQLGGGNS